MKYLILNGGPRKNGSTARLLHEIQKAIPAKDEGEWIDVYKLDIKPCAGCLGCRPDKECVLPEDDAHKIGRKISRAGALVVGSPTYWGNMSGPLKILFDRLVAVMEHMPVDGGSFPVPRHKGKSAVIVTSSNCPWPFSLLPGQSRGTITALKTVLKGGGFKIKGIIDYTGASRKGGLAQPAVKKAVKIGAGLG